MGRTGAVTFKGTPLTLAGKALSAGDAAPDFTLHYYEGGLKELKLCTGYDLDGEYTDILPMGADEISRCNPVYETMEGWSESTVGITQYEKLPVNARLYLQRIEQVTGVPIAMISTSPDRDHTIKMRHPYLAD